MCKMQFVEIDNCTPVILLFIATDSTDNLGVNNFPHSTAWLQALILTKQEATYLLVLLGY